MVPLPTRVSDPDGLPRHRTSDFLPTQCHNEASELLLADAALGHIVMTAGLGDDQFYWCNLCYAYTGERARKLTMTCDKRIRHVPVVERLRLGKHRQKGTDLVVRPRRLLKSDVGDQLICLEGSPDANAVLSSEGHPSHDGDIAAAISEVVMHPYYSYFYDDPDEDSLDLGCELG